MGQDALQKEKLAQIFKLLQSTGKTIIIVSHDVEFLWPIQPRLVVMSGGKVVADGKISEIMADRELLEGARVTQPQLLRLYSGLESRPADARSSTSSRRGTGSAEGRRRQEAGRAMYWLSGGFVFRRVVSPFHKLDPRVKLLVSMEFFVLSLLASTVVGGSPRPRSRSCSSRPWRSPSGGSAGPSPSRASSRSSSSR